MGRAEQIYLVRAAHFEPEPQLTWDALVAEGVTAIRWWTIEELASCDDVVAPRQLPALLRTLAREGLPSSVIDVGE